METTKYLWKNNGNQNNQFVVIYLDDNDKQIKGNLVTSSNTVNPYSESSMYKDAICVGIAKKFVSFQYPDTYPFLYR
tara:strand:+ start:431 stop:661 length:231 start_codon:yes stop_codon:yes gene_type:complete